MDIEFRGVTKRYSNTLALDDVSFEALSGSVTGFVGRNGAGKTTAIRILLGLVNPDSGTATIGGKRANELPAGVIGFLLESNAHPSCRVRDHLLVRAIRIGAARSEIDRVINLLDLQSLQRRKFGTLSLGQKQRVGLAGAILGNPSVLVLDEPANGLDPDGIFWLRDYLRSFAARGGSVLISSHILSELEQTVDSVVLLSGSVKWQGSLNKMRETGIDSLEKLFFSFSSETGEVA